MKKYIIVEYMYSAPKQLVSSAEVTFRLKKICHRQKCKMKNFELVKYNK